MKRSKIMIIEDDPVIQGELQTLLNGNGYTTLGVRNFSAVTEQIQDEKPHLILLDIKLPGENGFALCSKIRTFSEVPIIFVTSCNTDMDELNLLISEPVEDVNALQPGEIIAFYPNGDASGARRMGVYSGAWHMICATAGDPWVLECDIVENGGTLCRWKMVQG